MIGEDTNFLLKTQKRKGLKRFCRFFSSISRCIRKIAVWKKKWMRYSSVPSVRMQRRASMYSFLRSFVMMTIGCPFE